MRCRSGGERMLERARHPAADGLDLGEQFDGRSLPGWRACLEGKGMIVGWIRLALVIASALTWTPRDGAQAQQAQAGGQAASSFSIVVLPDTQYYAWRHPDLFEAQTGWIARNVEVYNVRYVIHVGDVVQHNNDAEWTVARRALSVLEGKVPYAIALGNHDLGPGGSARSRETLFGRHFPLESFASLPTFGGTYDLEPGRAENCYHVFRAGGRRWMILVLEFGPRDGVLRWAGDVVARHPDHAVILVTHAFIDGKGRRYDRALKDQDYPPQDYGVARSKEGLNTGEEIWQKLAGRFRNVVMVLCGHTCPLARLASRGEHGNTVHQLLVNYQDRKRGGNGWLRLLMFSDRGRRLTVRDYSPVLDRWAADPSGRFELTLCLPPSDASEEGGE